MRKIITCVMYCSKMRYAGSGKVLARGEKGLGVPGDLHSPPAPSLPLRRRRLLRNAKIEYGEKKGEERFGA